MTVAVVDTGQLVNLIVCPTPSLKQQTTLALWMTTAPEVRRQSACVGQFRRRPVGGQKHLTTGRPWFCSWRSLFVHYQRQRQVSTHKKGCISGKVVAVQWLAIPYSVMSLQCYIFDKAG